MLNYTKASDASLDFQVAVSGKGVQVAAPKIGMKINLKIVPERDNILEKAGRAAYHHCEKNNIPVDGGIFVILSCDEALEKGGNFKAMFVPNPAFHH
jgi:hypothetical protein